ncbi:hypothetical protein HGRIS_006408 [Hohenbuehelia grisea]
MRKKFSLVQHDVNQFMAEYEASQNPQIVTKMLYRVYTYKQVWSPPEELGSGLLSAYTRSFRNNFFLTLPTSFSGAFRALCASTLPSSDALPEELNAEPNLWYIFNILGLTERFEGLIANVGYDYIHEYILETCTEQWAEPMLEGVKEKMSKQIIPWLLSIYGRGDLHSEEAHAMLQSVAPKFEYHINKTLCTLRTREIFDIIIDFPDSMGALHDLKECLQRVDQRENLVDALRKSNHKRLLHPGADTKLILSQYVATIKCLRIIDPPGVLLFKVADPIRRYLRERPDTIRSIVANLVGDDDSGDSLVNENEPIHPLQQTEVEDYTDQQWEPDPIDAGPEFRTNKPSDVVSTLVSIYDSKDLFVKELQVLLAQRLLAINDDDTEKIDGERRNVEILKIRFGEAALQVCEVMLRDMSDSKRIDTHVQSQLPLVVHPTVISRHFWPALEPSDLVMPGQFLELHNQYALEFTKFKPDKKLRWFPHLGTVSLEIELEDRTVEAEVPPLEAAIIELFSQQNEWSIDGLVDATRVPDKTAILKALLTWVNLGVLREESETTFSLLEVAGDVPVGSREPIHRPTAAEPELPHVVSIQQQQAEQMRMYWKFIEGMLTNLGALSLDRIQMMLKFAPGYDRSIEQLATFLEAARREGLVVVRDGIWKLNR